MSLSKEFALYPLAENWGVRQINTFHRDALKALSYSTEQAIIDAQCSGTLYVGFQKFSFFLGREKMYRTLTEVVDQIWIFGLPDVALPPIPNVRYVPIASDHRLAKEWFLLMDSPSLFTCLVAQELTDLETPHEQRRFRGVWTFDDVLVTYLQTRLSNQLDQPPQPRVHKELVNYADQLTSVGLIANTLVRSLEESNERLYRAEAVQKEFTQMVVHDMRTPLTAMIIKLNTLIEYGRRQRDPAKIEQTHGELMRLARSLSHMVDDLLNISLAEDGNLTLTRTAVDPTKLIDATTMLILPKAQQKNVAFKTTHPNTLPTVYADFDKMRRVLSNLLNNAVKFTDAGGSVELSAVQKGAVVEFQVRDTGCGITLDPVEAVFKKYTKGNDGRITGTGIGLAYCKLMVEEHGGVISVKSRPNQGTTFTFTLPVA